MKNKTAKDIMTMDVIVANKSDSIADVAQLLIKEKIGGMPVISEDREVVGIISETDIMKKEKYVEAPQVLNLLQGLIFLNDFKQMEEDMKRIAAYKVEDLMSTEIITVHENDTFDDVANVMIKKSVNRVPVVDNNNKLKGIICRYDIIRSMYNE
ncbi:CBS domain-containing protein [Romboutsia lituseburensis]|uniref:CBS domain-containing protein n=1 Tax=Romboutsia lituseburensis TaxID=1537 RepID=UPI00215A3DB5|nr:CBS domain-containing protein [Romboutsia lituseburensis]MCR8746070.1 CBS domain-containing protein [Romboutsia lituseburensis]